MIRDRVSFVILTWNSKDYIGQCIAALFDAMAASVLEAEVHIVDNGSKDGTVSTIRALAKERPQRIFPVFLDKNYGTTYPRNLGLARCRGEFVCIMDSDVMLSPGVIDRLVRTLRSDKGTGLVAPGLVYADGRHQKSVDVFPTLPRKFQRYVNLRAMEKKEGRESLPESPRPVEYAISAVWLFRQSLARQIGGLDERIFYAPEDADFCLRVWKAGLKVVYEPRAVCVHHTQELSRGWRINPMVLHHIKGLAYYFFKHRYLFKRPRV